MRSAAQSSDVGAGEPGLELGGRQRLGEEKALADVAAELLQGDQRLAVLDALGDDGEVQVVAEANDAGDVGLALGEHRRDEGAVDLDLGHREQPQPQQRRVAGSEVVDRDREPELGERVEHGARLLGLVEHRGLGDFEGDDEAGTS